MEESGVAHTNNTTLTKRVRAVPLLQAMLDQLRAELATTRVALDSERSAVRVLKRDRASEIKAVREEEAKKRRDALSDLKSRLERDHEDALQRQKDAITKTLNAELLRALKAKDGELRQELSQAHAREEALKLQVRDAVRVSREPRVQQQAGAETQKLEQEVSALRTQVKQLEDRLQVVSDADRQKAADLRSQHDEHELQLLSIRKSSQQETHRLLEELKSKDRLISQLEKQLSLQTGRVEEQRERLLQSLENRRPNTMDRKSAGPKGKTLKLTGEIPESLTEKKEIPDALYSCILKEHLGLFCDHQPLQSKMKREMADRILLEHELATTRTKIRELKKMLAEERGGRAAMAERIAALQAEAHELREQNELLEFRILELEECQENVSVKSHSPDTRTDTESDSGIQSLPNSDDIASDIDLGIYDINIGRSLQNLPESTINSSDSSKMSSRIIAKVLPFTDLSADINDADGYSNVKKKLKSTECMQESGIFEDADFNTQSTQTDDISELESLLENGVGDLSAEIKKLTQFRELVEERGHCCDHKKLLCVEEGKDDVPQTSCASHFKELQYYRERLQILEDKIAVYESSGDAQTRLLANRLQKEVNLAAQVKELSTRVSHLTNLNRHLEEEKCEFEEAENDTRLKCQKLEVKIIALNERKSDLQAQLQQERRNLSRLRSSLSESERKRQEARSQLNYIEAVLNKYEQRNYELEEHEVELRHRLEMLENTMPALIMWNLWCMVQSRCLYKPMILPAEQVDIPKSEQCQCSRGKLEEDINRILSEKVEAEETWKITEGSLNEKLEVFQSKENLLTVELERCKEAEECFKARIQELETKKQDSANEEVLNIPSIKCECIERIQELADMKKRVSELELKERAYMETLQQADELWSEMENSYKAHIAKAEDREASLRDKVRKLEESETKLRYEEENYVLMEKIQNLEQKEKELKEKVRALESEKKNFLKEITQIREALAAAQSELKETKDLIEGPLKEELLREKKVSRMLQEEIKRIENEMQEASSAHDTQINGMKTQLIKTSRELVDMECTNGELKEEVETLEAKVCELKISLEFQKASEEKMLIQMSQTILEKEKELEAIKQEMEYAKIPSAHEELKEVQKQAAFPTSPDCQKPYIRDCASPDTPVALLPPALNQKPVLRRWLHQEKEWRQW